MELGECGAARAQQRQGVLPLVLSESDTLQTVGILPGVLSESESCQFSVLVPGMGLRCALSLLVRCAFAVLQICGQWLNSVTSTSACAVGI